MLRFFARALADFDLGVGPAIPGFPVRIRLSQFGSRYQIPGVCYFKLARKQQSSHVRSGMEEMRRCSLVEWMSYI